MQKMVIAKNRLHFFKCTIHQQTCTFTRLKNKSSELHFCKAHPVLRETEKPPRALQFRNKLQFFVLLTTEETEKLVTNDECVL